jgi:uncharacterized protein
LLLRAGVAQFNRGEYFAQHETLETLWRLETRTVRRLYRGILQIGVAFHHLGRGNYHGVVVMLERGLQNVRPFLPTCQGVDVDALVRDAERAMLVVQQLGSERLGAFDWRLAPQVRLLASPGG